MSRSDVALVTHHEISHATPIDWEHKVKKQPPECQIVWQMGHLAQGWGKTLSRLREVAHSMSLLAMGCS
jgi:hypothetical protein